MAIQYKADVLALLKAAGYPSTRIRAEKLLGQSYVQQLYVADEIPNAETIAAIKELDNGGGEHFTGSTEELFKKILSEPDEATGK